MNSPYIKVLYQYEIAISVKEKNVDDLWHVDNKVLLTEGVKKHPMICRLYRDP